MLAATGLTEAVEPRLVLELVQAATGLMKTAKPQLLCKLISTRTALKANGRAPVLSRAVLLSSDRADKDDRAAAHPEAGLDDS